MSGRAASGDTQAGLSKSAAKKRNKKASKATSGAGGAAQAGSSAEYEIDQAAAADAEAYAAAAAAAAASDHGLPGAYDFSNPDLFRLSQGAYPIGVQYEHTYDQHPSFPHPDALPPSSSFESGNFNFAAYHPGAGAGATGGKGPAGAAGLKQSGLNQLAATLGLQGIGPALQSFTAAGVQAGSAAAAQGGHLSGAAWPAQGSITNPVVGTNLTHEDLFLAANELYNRMGEADFGMDDPYWSSLTPNIRTFVRDAVHAPNGRQNGALAQHDIHSLAQRIVDAASNGMNLNSEIRRSLLATVNGQPHGAYPQTLGEELGFRRHPDAKDDEFDDEEEYDLEEPDMVAPNGDAPSKKKKKNKKKKNTGAVEPPPATLPPPAVKQPPRQPIPHPQQLQQHQQQQLQQQQQLLHQQQQQQLHHQQPAQHPPPPPVTPAPTQPPPGSRAAGKQPMTNAPAAAPQHRSARAAGKAPATAAPAHNHHHHNAAQQPAATAKSAAKGKAPANQPPAKIWQQSSAEEREQIRQFWLDLSEADRRGLLQIERDSMLRKLKDQHRSACGCAVCGRTKVNMDTELNTLFEQYYVELHSYARDQRVAHHGERPVPRGAGPFPGSVEVDSAGNVVKYDELAPDQGNAVHEELDDEGSEEYEDEEYEDEDELDEDDVASDDAEAGEDIDDTHPQPVAKTANARKPAVARPTAPRPDGSNDFHGFGNNLATIKAGNFSRYLSYPLHRVVPSPREGLTLTLGGILTVADELLQGNGSRFLEMMEQLAVARQMREEQNIQDIQDETDDEDYDENRHDHVTDAERKEQGRRMFQIFVARTFEQRVLQAYREKVARQREEQLLRELENEEEEKKQREEKRQEAAQKKKDKKRLQKEKAEREKAEREEELARAAAAAKAKKEEEERERARKQEEERQRRELVKKQAAEEQARQAAERRKRQQEEKEREEEAARKKREKEEKAKREREAREKEQREKEKREREEKAAREKAEQERVAKEKAEKAERERVAREKAAEKAAEKERERQAKLAEEQAEKARKAEIERRELEIALQEQTARAAADKAAADRAAADRLAAEQAARERARAVAAASAVPIASASTQPKPTRNGPTPHTTPPLDPSVASGSTARTANSRLQKTPQAFGAQPIPPTGAFPTRMPVGPGHSTQGFRPAGFSSVSPLFPASTANGTAVSPNPPTRTFQPEPSPPFDMPRTAPLGVGVGYPSSKATAQRIPSMDDAFSPPTAPIGVPQARVGSMSDAKLGVMGQSRVGSMSDGNQLGIGALSLDDGPFRREPAPIGIPPARSSVGSIGRPYMDSSASAHSTTRSSVPSAPDRILGSAALLSTDDEIVQPASAARRSNNGWPASSQIGLGGAPVSGPSRWSAAATSIWAPGADAANPVAPTPWGMPSIGERSTSSAQPSSQTRNPSFAAGSLGGIGGGLGGSLSAGSPAGFSPFGGGVFSPPPAPGLQQQLQHPHQQQQRQPSQQSAGQQHR